MAQPAVICTKKGERTVLPDWIQAGVISRFTSIPHKKE